LRGNPLWNCESTNNVGDVGQKAARYNLVSFVHPDSVFITCTYVYRTSRSGAW
jgi:hypothetical protein